MRWIGGHIKYLRATSTKNHHAAHDPNFVIPAQAGIRLILVRCGNVRGWIAA